MPLVRLPALALALLATAFAGCTGGGGGGGCVHGSSGEFVEFRTSKGTFTAELFPDEAPITVENFQRYVREGFFDGTIVHRVEPGFVIQGGGYNKDVQQKETHDPIPLEVGPALKNEARTLSMARTGNPDSATSQFFVNLVDNRNLDPTPGVRGGEGYAVFGKVVAGWEVVERIAAVSLTDSPLGGDHPNFPEETVSFRCVRLLETVGEERTGWEAYLFQDEYDVAPGGLVTFPVVVRNTGTAELAFVVSADFESGWDGTVEEGRDEFTLGREDGAVNLIGVEAPDDVEGQSTVTITVTPSQGAARELPVTLRVNASIQPPRIASEENNLVQVRYVGFFDDGRFFDTNLAALWNNESMPRNLPPGVGRHTDPLLVNASGEARRVDDAGYSPVIVGFRDALYDLAAGETASVRIPPERAYDDGLVRLFQVSVLSIDGTG